MTPPETLATLPPLVRRTVERLVRAFAPERILLFGSRAKGTAHEGSDVDVLVVANITGNPNLHLRRARQLAADAFPRMDIVLATPDDLANARSDNDHFLLSVLGTGMEIYRRRCDTVRANKDDSQYEIKSDTTDHIAMHKGSALRKLSR